LIQQAHLANVNLELEVLENGLLIRPINNTSRDTWKANIEKTILKNQSFKDEALLEDWQW